MPTLAEQRATFLEDRLAFEQSRLDQIETILTESAGLKTVAVGNTNYSYDELEKIRDKYAARLARQLGLISRVKRMNLGR